VRAIPTSNQVAELAREYGIPLLGRLEGPIDLDIDGADEIDPDLNLLKGGGGALAREKLVAEAARRLVVVADSSKLVERLARATRLPVEVLPFLWRRTAGRIEDLGGTASLRGGEDRPFLTDNGNWILDVSVPGGIGDPGGFGSALKALTGVVDHGLFTGLARACLVAGEAGVTVLGRLDS
ncbi:MAG: ribose 5-phosphate isomerase A, partial [Candidatus Dormibacteraceae bacterium]